MASRDDREGALLDTLVGLADSLVSDFDVVELTERLTHACVDLLAVDAAGLVLANPRGGLQAMTATNPAVHRLELEQTQYDEGPCVEAYLSSSSVSVDDVQDAVTRWPRFAPASLKSGYQAVHALPLRLRSQTIGALNLFHAHPGPLHEQDRHAGQALADVATIAVLQHRTLYESHRLVSQLESALSSRIVIEQAKGRLLERGNLPTADDAFSLLRRYARDTNQRLTDVAHALMENDIDAAFVLGATHTATRNDDTPTASPG